MNNYASYRFEIDSGHTNSVPDGVFLNITSNRCDI